MVIYHPIASLYDQAYKPYCRKDTTCDGQPEKYTNTTKPTVSSEIKSFAITQNFIVFLA